MVEMILQPKTETNSFTPSTYMNADIMPWSTD